MTMSPAKGKPMPQTPEQFQRMGDLYEKALLKAQAENSRLRAEVHELRAKLSAKKRPGRG